MIYVVRTGSAWSVVQQDGQLVAHRRVRAVHSTRGAAYLAAQRFAKLTGTPVAPLDEEDELAATDEESRA